MRFVYWDFSVDIVLTLCLHALGPFETGPFRCTGVIPAFSPDSLRLQSCQSSL